MAITNQCAYLRIHVQNGNFLGFHLFSIHKWPFFVTERASSALGFQAWFLTWFILVLKKYDTIYCNIVISRFKLKANWELGPEGFFEISKTFLNFL